MSNVHCISYTILVYWIYIYIYCSYIITILDIYIYCKRVICNIKLTVLTETHADCNKKYNLIYYTVKPQAVFLVCPSGGLYTKLTKEYNIN